MVSMNYLAIRTIEKIKNLFPYQPIIKTEPKGNHTHVPIVFYFGVIKPAFKARVVRIKLSEIIIIG
jgi:hypothetical protein